MTRLLFALLLIRLMMAAPAMAGDVIIPDNGGVPLPSDPAAEAQRKADYAVARQRYLQIKRAAEAAAIAARQGKFKNDR